MQGAYILSIEISSCGNVTDRNSLVYDMYRPTYWYSSLQEVAKVALWQHPRKLQRQGFSHDPNDHWSLQTLKRLAWFCLELKSTGYTNHGSCCQPHPALWQSSARWRRLQCHTPLHRSAFGPPPWCATALKALWWLLPQGHGLPVLSPTTTAMKLRSSCRPWWTLLDRCIFLVQMTRRYAGRDVYVFIFDRDWTEIWIAISNASVLSSFSWSVLPVIQSLTSNT